MANPSLIITATDQASPAIARVRSSLDELLRSFGGFGGQAAKLSVPLLGVSAAIVGIGAAVANAVNVTRWVDELADSGSALGISAENMAKYQILAKQAGVEATALGGAFQTLAKNVEGAKAGQAAQVELFRRLGISVKELKQLTPDETITRVAQAFTELQAGFGKAALSAEAFGKAGKNIDDAMQRIASGEQVVTGLTKEFVEESQKLNRALDLLEITVKRISVTLAGPVVTAILAVAEALNLLPKTPLEELGNQVERLRKRIAEEGTFKGALKYWPMSKEELAEKKAQLKELEDQGTRMFRAMERAQFGGGPGSREVPEEIDPAIATRAKAAAEAARKARERLVDEQEKAALRTQNVAFENYLQQEANSQKHYEREQNAAREHTEKMAKLFAEIYEEERVAIEKGAEIIAARRAEQIEQVEARINDLTQVTESFFLKLTSFEGEDIFKTLAKDLANLAYRMIVLGPLLENIRTVLKDMANTVEYGGKGEGWIGMLMKVFGLVGTGASATGVSDFSYGMQTRQLGGPLIGPTLVGEAGPEIVIPHHRTGSSAMGSVSIVQNNSIDSRSDIGTISAMLEMNKQSTLRAVREQLARRSPNLRV